jgi:hypothetical protein
MVHLRREVTVTMRANLTEWIGGEFERPQLPPIRSVSARGGGTAFLLELFSMCETAATLGEFPTAGVQTRSQDASHVAATFHAVSGVDVGLLPRIDLGNLSGAAPGALA